MRRLRNVKIVATLGPASETYDTIRALFESGADVFRLNMSHGSHAEIKSKHTIIRQIEKDLDRPIAILADLQGPKLRCGVFENGSVDLHNDSDFLFDLIDKPGNQNRVFLPHKEIFNVIRASESILVDDGKIRLKVKSVAKNQIKCIVEIGGRISDKKGINVPQTIIPTAALSRKDKIDLEFACNLGIDWLALSFVQRAKDVNEARKLAKGRTSILSKIEKPSAVTDFNSILEVSDGIMIARGDLGVEMPVQAIPPIQKRLVMACRHVAKPVIVATQMLDSMVDSPMPTRAEVSDVATAIYEGADAVMLSAESAAGNFPIDAVKTMDNIAIEIENDPAYRELIDSTRSGQRKTVADAITVAAREIAETTEVTAICCFTHSGTTASLVSRERPRVPIIALTPLIKTARRLCLHWGAHCVITGHVDRFKKAVISAARAAKKYNFATIDKQIIVTAGVPFNKPGTTNIIRVSPVDEKLIFSGDHE